MSKAISVLLGQRFGMLTVTAQVSSVVNKQGKRRRAWLCLCDCGNTKVVASNLLHNQLTTSCGCIWRKIRLQLGEAGFNKLFVTYQSNARKRGLEFSLTEELFRSITESKCWYCDLAPSSVSALNTGSEKSQVHSRYIYNGIDRVNNDLGYVPGNVVSCCKSCNIAKGTRSQEDFLSWARKVAATHPGF